MYKPVPKELEREVGFLDENIPSYEAFLALLREAKPKDGSLVFDIWMNFTFTLSQAAMKWFIKTRLYEWDPTLIGRVCAVQPRPEINLCCVMIRLNLGINGFQVNLEDGFKGYYLVK
jgi:hypothetical protein